MWVLDAFYFIRVVCVGVGGMTWHGETTDHIQAASKPRTPFGPPSHKQLTTQQKSAPVGVVEALLVQQRPDQAVGQGGVDAVAAQVRGLQQLCLGLGFGVW